MWPHLLPPAIPGGWMWGDAQGGFQRKVFLGFGGGIPGLSLTSPVEMCQRGARLKNHTHHQPKNPNNNSSKTPTPTCSFPAARNTPKLRGSRQLLSAFVPRTHPTTIVSLVTGVGRRWGPLGTSNLAERCFRLPRREVLIVVHLAGFHSPWPCPDLSKPRPVSRPVRSHGPGKMLGAASLTYRGRSSPTHPFPCTV